MRSRRRHRGAGCWAWAWLMLAIGAALSSTEAQAGCNHPWVTTSHVSTLLDRLSIFELGQTGATSDHSLPVDRRSPCARGECSRSPNLPDRDGITIAERAELWGDLPEVYRPPLTPFRSFREPDEGARPARISFPLERPPRAILSPR